jgi:hypothetical protein
LIILTNVRVPVEKYSGSNDCDISMKYPPFVLPLPTSIRLVVNLRFGGTVPKTASSPSSCGVTNLTEKLGEAFTGVIPATNSFTLSFLSNSVFRPLATTT